jgi:centromeric protein E
LSSSTTADGATIDAKKRQDSGMGTLDASHMVPPRESSLKQGKKRTGKRRAGSTSSSKSARPSFGGSMSMINGSADGKTVPRESRLKPPGLPSPPQSRDPSPHGSTATSFEEYGADAAADTKSIKSIKDTGKGNVVVGVRIRPEPPQEAKRSQQEWGVDGDEGIITYKGRDGGDYLYGKFPYGRSYIAATNPRLDNVFTGNDSNARVYDSTAKRLVRRVMEGYHGTVFAYGMTGTGKTFSMQGTAGSLGIIPLAIADIFSFIRETPHREFLLRVSYLEIYNERILDLLIDPASMGQPQEEIKLREDSKRGVYATPLKEEIVQSPNQLLRVIGRGDAARKVGSTQFNLRSSRSHAVVQIVVESRERVPGGSSLSDSRGKAAQPGGVRVSTLSLIDLAGSERAAEDKERQKEGKHINKSLLTLGTIVAKLSESKKGGGNHLPYRDSKLTRLLQPALSGDSLISILCTVALSASGNVAAQSSQIGETLNTLKFALRAKNSIVSHAKKAEESYGSGGDAGSRALLDRYRLEIDDLRKKLEEQAKSNKERDEREKVADEVAEKVLEVKAGHRREEQMLEMQLARTALKERIEHLNRLILSSRSAGVNSTSRSVANYGLNSRVSVLSSATAPLTASDFHAQIVSQRSSSASYAMTEPYPLGKSSANWSASTPALHNQTSSSPRSSSVNGHGFHDTGSDEADSMLGDGTASSQAQIRALQADLADKNRYIATLENRLHHARRTSNSRTSLTLGDNSRQKDRLKAAVDALGGSDEARAAVEALMKEKDAEIAELRAVVDDKDRMMTSLRSAARRRDIADLASGIDNITSTLIGPRRPGHAPPMNSPPTSAPPPLPPTASPSATSSVFWGDDRKSLVMPKRRSSVHGHVTGGSFGRSRGDSLAALLEKDGKTNDGMEDMQRMVDEMISGPSGQRSSS